MAGISNEFSWSKTRHAKFNACMRDYYLTYYEAWGGWEKQASEASRIAYTLKKLENRFSWSGKVSHATIAEALDRIRKRLPMDGGKLIDEARATMRRDYKLSSQRAYWQTKIRKDFGGLVEHQYNDPVSKADWSLLWDQTEQKLKWWLSSQWPELARSLKPEEWLAADVKDFSKNFFTLNGVKVYAIPDFAYLVADGANVVDWKTGAPRQSFDGGGVAYGLFLQERFGVDVNTMQETMVYLADGSQKSLPITQQLVDVFTGAFDSSVGAMKTRLMGKGNANRPLPDDAYPKTDNMQACARCVYRLVCKREGC